MVVPAVTETAGIARVLRRIAAEIAQLRDQQRDHLREHPENATHDLACDHDLHCAALKIACQAELIERALVD